MDTTPKKYIRTLAGDIETLQSGGVPDLAPLKEPEQTPAERLIAESPIPPVPVKVEVEISKPAVPPPPPAPAAPPKPTPLKTYTGDFMKRVKEARASTVSILAAEQDAAQQVPQVAKEEPEQKINRWYIAGGVALLLVGSIAAYIAYSRYLSASVPLLIAPSISAPIFVDSREQVSGTGTALMQMIKQSIDKTMPLNTVRLIHFDPAATTTTSVFAALDAHAPGILVRNSNTVGSMAGIVKTNSGQSPFFILSVSSYSATFSGMLSWESTMLSDLKPLFPPYPTTALPAATSTTAISTSTQSVSNGKVGFRDEVIGNHDVRVYRDAEGRSVLLYGYWNQRTLIIARDPLAFAEILGRLATSRMQQ